MSPEKVQSHLKNLRVLYVEDDLDTREELELILRHYFDVLYVAFNGSEGLELFSQFAPDIVITDIQMPEMNGLTMSAEIKKLNPDQAIVVLSAYNDVEYLFRALELGIQNYVTKPVKVDNLINVLSDIASQMALQQQVLHNQRLLEQYKLLVDEKAIVVKTNQKGYITFINRHFCDISGYSEQELLGQHYAVLCKQENPEQLIEEICFSLKNSHKWSGMLKKCAKDGYVFVVDASIVAIIDENGETLEYVALMVDMTEIYARFERLSLNLEHDLKEQKHFLQEYERSLDLGTSLCVLNPAGVIIRANKTFSDSLSCEPAELEGKAFSEIVQDYPEFHDRLMHKIKSQGYTSRVINMKAKEGCERTFSTVIVGIRDQQGDLHSLLGLSQDITESVKLNNDIMETQKELIYVMGEVVENRSQETGMHIRRVANVSALLASKYGLSEEHAEMIKIASPMHDIGKVGIPDSILHKPARLSEEEFAVMQTHANLGFDLLNKLDRPLIQMAAKIAHEHHEHFDGHGYPNGLKGESISIEGRIVSLVDVVDALGSRRAYKEPWSDQRILDYVISKRGSQFDPELVDLLLANFEEIKAIRQLYQDTDH